MLLKFLLEIIKSIVGKKAYFQSHIEIAGNMWSVDVSTGPMNGT